jgi:hypothetical protein
MGSLGLPDSKISLHKSTQPTLAHFILGVFYELLKCNVIAFTLHLRGSVKGIIVKGIIVIL